MSKHKKYYCRERTVPADPEKESLRERVASLEGQLFMALARNAALDKNHVEIELRERVASLEGQLTTALARNATLEHLLGEQLSEVKEELRQTKKRKDRYADVATARRKLSEPARRQIAQGQMWKCAGEACALAGELQEYDIDHVIPLWKGGTDEPANMQALCPACHRRKTNRERLERSQGTPALQFSDVQGCSD